MARGAILLHGEYSVFNVTSYQQLPTADGYAPAASPSCPGVIKTRAASSRVAANGRGGGGAARCKLEVRLRLVSKTFLRAHVG